MADKKRKQVLLRLSPELYGELVQWADDEFRSVNGQIEYLLTTLVRQKRKSGQSSEGKNLLRSREGSFDDASGKEDENELQ